MTQNPTMQATETVYKATAESLKLAIQSARSARELAEEQTRATRELVKKTLPREFLPYFEATERFVDIQVETADRFLSQVTEQVQTLVQTPPTQQADQVTNYVQAQMKLAADQFDTVAKITKTQFDAIFSATNTFVPKEYAPLVAQAKAGYEKQQELLQQTYETVTKAAESSSKAAGKTATAPSKKRK